jgi:hypothetical protein
MGGWPFDVSRETSKERLFPRHSHAAGEFTWRRSFFGENLKSCTMAYSPFIFETELVERLVMPTGVVIVRRLRDNEHSPNSQKTG